MPAGSRAFAVSVLTATAALGRRHRRDAADGRRPGAVGLAHPLPGAAAGPAGRRAPRADSSPRPSASQPRDQRGTHRGRTAAGVAAAGRHRSRPAGAAVRVRVCRSRSSCCPPASFLNEYLRTDRGFSAGTITAVPDPHQHPGRHRHRGGRPAGRSTGPPPHRRHRRRRRGRVHGGHVPHRRLVDLDVLAARLRVRGHGRAGPRRVRTRAVPHRGTGAGQRRDQPGRR